MDDRKELYYKIQQYNKEVQELLIESQFLPKDIIKYILIDYLDKLNYIEEIKCTSCDKEATHYNEWHAHCNKLRGDFFCKRHFYRYFDMLTD